jgi:hypothetical protein
MPIRPSVVHSYKYLILSKWSPSDFLNISLNYNIVNILYVYLFLNKFRNFVYDVTDALHKSLFLLPQELCN